MQSFKEIYVYREMVFSLVRRDLKGHYKGSVLGFFWTFLSSLLQPVVYTFTFSVIMKSNIEYYYLHLFVTLIPWSLFSMSASERCSCIRSQQDAAKKTYFPREVLPIAYATSQSINMLLGFVVILLVVLLSGRGFNPVVLLYLPVIAIVGYLLCLGLAFLVSVITVYVCDTEYLLKIVTMVLQFLTPVIYSTDIVLECYMTIYVLSPITPTIVAYRDILYCGKIPRLTTLFRAVLMSVVLLVVGFLIFDKLGHRFVGGLWSVRERRRTVMSDPVSIDRTMQELRNNAKSKSYPKEAVASDAVCARKKETEGFDFFKELMKEDVRYVNRSYYVNYDQSIISRSPRIKKLTKSLYQFHLRPLWDAQSCFNLRAASAMSQIRNSVLQ